MTPNVAFSGGGTPSAERQCYANPFITQITNFNIFTVNSMLPGNNLSAVADSLYNDRV
jgi:hypothetical protein